VHALREWREISGGVGVPVVAHGTDVVIGFNEHRLEELAKSCDQMTSSEDLGDLPG
jgi:hypothetical protein